MDQSGARHWKVDYRTFSGALTVRAGTLLDAKRITAELTRTGPDDVLDACCVDEADERPRPVNAKARRDPLGNPRLAAPRRLARY